jgi:hypothetical protein
MQEKIVIQKGILREFDIDDTIEILKIGYTLNPEGTGYKNAIIVRDADDMDIIADNQEEIMRFMNLLAEQQKMPLDRIFDGNLVMQLHGNDEQKMSNLVARMHYLEYLYKNKKKNKICIVLLAFTSLLSYGIISLSNIKNEQMISGLIGMITSFFAGKLFVDTKNIPTNQHQEELDRDIQAFGDSLLNDNSYSR